MYTPGLKSYNSQCQTGTVCDASDFCIGSVWEKLSNGKWHSMEFYSKEIDHVE